MSMFGDWIDVDIWRLELYRYVEVGLISISGGWTDRYMEFGLISILYQSWAPNGTQSVHKDCSTAVSRVSFHFMCSVLHSVYSVLLKTS